jgi:hypothetical protein
MFGMIPLQFFYFIATQEISIISTSYHRHSLTIWGHKSTLAHVQIAYQIWKLR